MRVPDLHAGHAFWLRPDLRGVDPYKQGCNVLSESVGLHCCY
jgi:hypothetical protein